MHDALVESIDSGGGNALERVWASPAGSLDEILEADRRARDVAASLLAAD